MKLRTFLVAAGSISGVFFLTGCGTQAPKHFTDSAIVAKDHTVPITQVAMFAGVSNKPIIEHAKDEVLASLESQFKKQNIPLTVYPASAGSFERTAQNQLVPRLDYLAKPDYQAPGVQDGNPAAPSHIAYLSMQSTSYQGVSRNFGPEDSITGLAYRIELVEIATKKIVYVYSAKTSGERHGTAAIWAGSKFFERLKADGLL